MVVPVVQHDRAQHRDHREGGHGGKQRADEEAQYAQTVRVTPVTETVKVPREECRNETTTRYVKQRDATTGTGTVVGAVVGGLLGNQVGGGSGAKTRLRCSDHRDV